MAVESARDAVVLRYRDLHTGCVIRVSTPNTRPWLWQQYLAGAQRVYRRYGVESALEYERFADGDGTALFAAVCARGEAGGDVVVAGLRAQRPVTGPDRVHGLAAWRGRPGHAELSRAVAERVDAGIVEVKAVWADRAATRRPELGATLARAVVHLTWLLGARYGFVTTGDGNVDRYASSGARVQPGVPPVPYPDDRYRTVPMWWDLHRPDDAEPLQRILVAAERAELAGRLAALGRPAPTGGAYEGRIGA
ncbi:hypothetical protein ACWEVD_28850 [Nocardia thailandica]|uniref:GNAT family N-acetyltransferase n=1 Tax=Nocardia thailandica TaxID=257275 RepID=A0ABW6PSH7_9NOCA